ncbi:MAG TPA: glycosyltransferase family 39 protein [Candidatus Baltobacteraceae bacterium]|jgi:Gpi18-like mannosyltransferase
MSTSKIDTRTEIASEQAASTPVFFWLILAAGLVLRLIFITNQGFKGDVLSFEAWALALNSHPFSQFYNTTSFADYPPGYFYVLWFVGHVFALLGSHDYALLGSLAKLPAIAMDLVDGAIVFAIVRRFADARWALIATGIFVLNPAMIFISAVWGQVDSVSGGLALLGVYLLLRSDDRDASAFSWDVLLAWLALGYSLLIKPQAAVLIPLFVAFAFVAPQRRRQRLIATAAGIVGASILAFAIVVPFHPTLNPVDAFTWLYQKYNFGKNVYPDNSVNAFNLWAIRWPFWQPDNQPVLFAPMSLWGIVLVVGAAILVVVRYVQIATSRALLESALLLTLAFYMLATRMHERYIFDGLAFAIVAIPFAKRYFWSALVLSFTLLVNLFYSLSYLTVVTDRVPGIDARDMWPWITHPLSLLNVAVFFYLGYVFVGQSADESAVKPLAVPELGATGDHARHWFDPREGLATLRWPLDYVAAASVGIFSFVLSFVNYWKPGDKIFDEIYFARAAEEYLSHKYIYENTHPPLTKLIITLSTMLFGGLHGGDNAHGWRFLDVVFGAIAVIVLYAFAKRITRSTFFATITALLFTFDGMHFVQSRIATPEGIVVVFSLATLYAFYRFWIASQATVRPDESDRRSLRIGVSAGGAIVLGSALSALLNELLTKQSAPAFVVCALYFAFGFYLLLRLAVVPAIFGRGRGFASYPDGSYALEGPAGYAIHTVDGRALDPARKDGHVLRDDELTVEYDRDATVRYATPAGTGTYVPGRVDDDAGESQQGRHATGWLVAFTLLLGCLVASKWYGVMAYGVSFIVILAVWLQRYFRWRRPKLWGNPYGFRLDVAFAAIVFLSMTVYAMVWIPDAVRSIPQEVQNVSDVVNRQYTMFEYHDTLKATHPYQSVWWQWPLDARPVAYYWKDSRKGVAANDSGACCVAEILTLPNPIILWFGLFCVPVVGYLAWRERNKGYALLVLAYLLQWLPWMRSPRITFAYHFYVDIPLICLCNAIVLQRIWHVGQNKDARLWARIGVGAYVAAVALAFIWFYPILAGTPLVWSEWNDRMWHAIVGNAWI